MIDHRQLLVKYIARVINSESYDYIEYDGACTPVPAALALTDDELAELAKLSAEAKALL